MVFDTNQESGVSDRKAVTSVFARIGFLSFGGPAAQIALMHKELVDDRRWLTEKQFLNALNFCMLLPGPEAMQLATYAGWRLHGVLGGIISGLLFVLPGAAIVLLLALAYVYLGSLPLVNALFLGIKAAVLVIVLDALVKVSKRTLLKPGYWVIAISAFIAIFFLQLPFPLIILTAALAGFLQGTDQGSKDTSYTSVQNATDMSVKSAEEGSTSSRAQSSSEGLVQPAEGGLDRLVRITLLGIALWAVPFLCLMAVPGNPILPEIAAFFSRLAVVTFGGAYAVLAYMVQDVVDNFGWLTTGEMMDALGLAETTPGPLILVTEFVGFIAAFHAGGLLTGLLGALITLWVTFVPCFIWVFAGAPYIERIASNARLNSAMSAITAAVVGVILNLSLWFALHVLFPSLQYTALGPIRVPMPDLSEMTWQIFPLCLLCGLLLLKYRWSVAPTLLVSAALGVLISLIST